MHPKPRWFPVHGQAHCGARGGNQELWPPPQSSFMLSLRPSTTESGVRLHRFSTRISFFFFFLPLEKNTQKYLCHPISKFSRNISSSQKEILILIDDRGAGSPKLKRCRPQSSLVARDLPSQLPGFGGEVTAATKARPSTWIRAQRGTGTSALCRRGCRWRGEASANPSERCLSGVRLGRGLAW